MTTTNPVEITSLLRDVSDGKPGAFDQLLPVVYDQLKQIARQRLRRESDAATLATTDLVHEAYLKLAPAPERVDWQSRGHFYAIASRAMRQVLITRALAKRTTKRGSGAEHVSVDDEIPMSEERAEELLAIDEGLQLLEQSNPRLAQVIDLRYFGGFSISETAKSLDISDATVNRDWRVARLWLYNFLKNDLV